MFAGVYGMQDPVSYMHKNFTGRITVCIKNFTGRMTIVASYETQIDIYTVQHKYMLIKNMCYMSTIAALILLNFHQHENKMYLSMNRAEKPGVATDNTLTGMEALEGFVMGLYMEAFQALVSLINR